MIDHTMNIFKSCIN